MGVYLQRGLERSGEGLTGQGLILDGTRGSKGRFAVCRKWFCTQALCVATGENLQAKGKGLVATEELNASQPGNPPSEK